MLKKLSKQERVYFVVNSLVTAGNSLMVLESIMLRRSILLPIVSIAISFLLVKRIKLDFEQQEVEKM